MGRVFKLYHQGKGIADYVYFYAMQPLLTINGLSVNFTTNTGITHALQNISFTVAKGEIVAVVGESGSGKSVTSLAVLQLLQAPPAVYTDGEILFSDDNNTVNLLQQTQEQMEKIRGNRIAMIFQEPMTSLNPVTTCGGQVAEAIILHKKLSADAARQATIALFEQVKLPNPAAMYNRYPHQLSGGQKQRVMIAMAMSCSPALLICDEPTTALDVTVQKNILQLIKGLQQQNNMGVIFISHDLAVVAEIADRIVVMYKGKIVEQGLSNDVIKNPKHPYTQALLACRPALHSKGERLPVVSNYLSTRDEVRGTNIPGTIDEVQSTNEASTRYEVRGTNLTSTNNEVRSTNEPARLNITNNQTFKQSNTQTATPLLEVKNLQVHYPAKRNFLGKPVGFTKAVNNVSLTVYKGETLGLVGESGCGKTTLGRAVLGLIKPTVGSVIFNGIDITAADPKTWRALRKDMQIIFQDPYSSLNPRKTIGAAIAEPLLVHALYPTAQQRRDKVIELLEKTGLTAGHYNRYPHEFSGGQRQRIVIARALALEPSFIVCDESVSALDVSVQAQVLNLLNDLKKEMGFTIVFISHDLSVVRYISDRIMVMNKGKIEEIGNAEQVYFHPKKEYTKQLIASIPKGR